MNQNGTEAKKSILTRKRLIAAAFSLLLAVLIFTGASFSFLHMQTGSVKNIFSKGSVGAEIEEVFTNNAKSSITVKNIGNSPAYVRVRLVSYWQNSDGTIAAQASPAVSFILASEWTRLGEYYYYTQPVGGGEETDNLLGKSIALAEDQVIDVIAEVVQATPAKAVVDVWGVSAESFLK